MVLGLKDAGRVVGRDRFPPPRPAVRETWFVISDDESSSVQSIWTDFGATERRKPDLNAGRVEGRDRFPSLPPGFGENGGKRQSHPRVPGLPGENDGRDLQLQEWPRDLRDLQALGQDLRHWQDG